MEVFWYPRLVPVEMFWARGNTKADEVHAAGLVAFICLDPPGDPEGKLEEEAGEVAWSEPPH